MVLQTLNEDSRTACRGLIFAAHAFSRLLSDGVSSLSACMMLALKASPAMMP
jgi:hypothetical protein